MPTKLYMAGYSKLPVANLPLVEFRGAGGRAKKLSKCCTMFFFEKRSFMKILLGAFVFWEIARNGSIQGIRLFFKGGLNVLMRRRLPLSEGEYGELLGAVAGFRIKEIAFTAGRYLFIISSRQTEAFALIDHVAMRNQYIASAANMRGKVVVDAGANLGVFSLLAARLGARRVYAFEPVRETFLRLEENIALNGFTGKIVPVNKALGASRKSMQLSYSCAGDATASLVFRQGQKFQRVAVIALDSFMKGRGRVDFIKMDVEGYEAEVLTGAAGTIREHKPKLAFSAYHKPGDKEELPALVRSLRRDYSCTLHDSGEENFFCE